jgi:hypothetical protein
MNLVKVQCELNQLINHQHIAEELYRANCSDIRCFEWLSQIRTYERHHEDYHTEIGINDFAYGF